MTEINNQETVKAKTGRKPIEDKKIPITIYRAKSEVMKMGGVSEARRIINNYIDEYFSNPLNKI